VPRRICVVGNSGAGKTTFARRLARRLGVPHVELDALNHRAGWTQAPDDEFAAELRARLAGAPDGWVVDGNYRSRIGHVLQPDTCVWLDYPRRVVMARVVRRTVGRGLLRRELWNGNRERLSSLLRRSPEDNIVLWAWTQHERYRRDYATASAADVGAEWVRLRGPREAERWLAALRW
jgi:adenylate kinase family enzyme